MTWLGIPLIAISLTLFFMLLILRGFVRIERLEHSPGPPKKRIWTFYAILSVGALAFFVAAVLFWCGVWG